MRYVLFRVKGGWGFRIYGPTGLWYQQRTRPGDPRAVMDEAEARERAEALFAAATAQVEAAEAAEAEVAEVVQG